MKENWFGKVLNVLFVIAWLAIAGTIIFSFVMRDRLTIYNYGTYLYNLGLINLFAFIIIFIKSVIYDKYKK